MTSNSLWPALPLPAWRDTCDTLHMYAQIIGKIRLQFAYPEPEWAHVPLYVTLRGLTTGLIPCGDRVFQIDFDLHGHTVEVAVSNGASRSIALGDCTVADFYADVMEALHTLDIDAHIRPIPDEVPDPIPFPQDTQHKTYDREYVSRFWRVLLQIDSVLKEHRAPFRGRHTLVQFFWGSFDLSYTRFSGRPATPPRNDIITREAMDAEEICAGFWPGDDRYPEPAFWCYAYPRPAGLENAKIAPEGASWNPQLGEFILPYETVRKSESPRALLLDFFRSSYDVCAHLANWDTSFSPRIQ